MSTSNRGQRRLRRWALVGVAALGLSAAPIARAAAAPSPQACANRTNNTYSKLLECVRLEGVRAHQAALQAIADANGGNRAAGSPGYTGSVEYVVDTLEAAGWNVTLDEFPFTFIPPPTLQQLTPVAGDLRDRRLHRERVRDGHGQRHPGRHQPRPAAVDHATSGCEAGRLRRGDFGGSVATSP